MKNSILLVSVGLAAGLLATPAFAQQDNCRGNADLTKFKSYEQGAHVFTARNSNKGKGNGGESFVVDLDAVALAAGDIIVTSIHECVQTADEDTGVPEGAHIIVGDHVEVAPRVDIGEFDPGKGNQPPPP